MEVDVPDFLTGTLLILVGLGAYSAQLRIRQRFQINSLKQNLLGTLCSNQGHEATLNSLRGIRDNAKNRALNIVSITNHRVVGTMLEQLICCDLRLAPTYASYGAHIELLDCSFKRLESLVVIAVKAKPQEKNACDERYALALRVLGAHADNTIHDMLCAIEAEIAVIEALYRVDSIKSATAIGRLKVLLARQPERQTRT